MSYNDGFNIKGIPFVLPVPGTASMLVSTPDGSGWTAAGIVDNAISASVYVIETIETQGNIDGNGAPEDPVKLKNDISLTSVTASFNGNGSNVTNITASNITNFTADVRTQLTGSQYVDYNKTSGQLSLPQTGTILGTTPLILGQTTTALSGLNTIQSTNITGTNITSSQILSTTGQFVSLTGSSVTASNILSTTGQFVSLTGSSVTASNILSTVLQTINFTASFISSSNVLATTGQFINLTGSYITGTQLIIDYTDYNTSLTVPAFKTGRLHYNPDTADLEYDTDISTVTMQYGQQLVVKVKNENVQTINKGKLVRIVGGSGANPLIRTASWENDEYSANTLGMVMQTVAPNGFTYVLLNGIIKDINLSAAQYTEGDLLYLSSSGNYTNVKPQSPLHTVRLGQVVRAQSANGVAFIKVDNGYELDELHDTLILTASLGDLVVYDSATSLWKNTKTLSGSYTVTGTLSASVITANSITGSGIYFSASNPSHWSSPAPTTISAAINRLAAAVSSLLTGTIP